MANSALDIINDHIGGGQAKLAAYRKRYSGSGVYVPPAKFSDRDERLLESLMCARDVLDAAQFGMDDSKLRYAVERWAALEWGGFYERESFCKVRPLPKPAPRELLRATHESWLVHEGGG